MKVLKFTGELLDIMVEDARKNWSKDCGLKFHNGHQNAEDQITLMEVIDESKASKYYKLEGVEILNEEQANEILTTKMDRIIYKKYDEALYGANIQKKIGDATLDIDKMLPSWTDQEELEHLYSKGISGIKRKEIVVEKFKELIVEKQL